MSDYFQLMSADSDRGKFCQSTTAARTRGQYNTKFVKRHVAVASEAIGQLFSERVVKVWNSLPQKNCELFLTDII